MTMLSLIAACALPFVQDNVLGRRRHPRAVSLTCGSKQLSSFYPRGRECTPFRFKADLFHIFACKRATDCGRSSIARAWATKRASLVTS